jgi:hypothetical protein
MWPGSISNKARGKLNSKLAVLKGTRPQKSKMASFHNKTKDEGELGNHGHIAPDVEINDTKFQGGSAAHGRHVSKGGGIGKAESQMKRHAIDDPVNKKVWPHGGDVKAGNPKTGNTRMKGPIARSGGLYGGGGRGTQ